MSVTCRSMPRGHRKASTGATDEDGRLSDVHPHGLVPSRLGPILRS